MLRGQKGERRDPTRLLREEKMRKRITKELPKVTAELVKTLEKYEDEYGRPFLVKGDRYLDEIAAAEAKVPPPRAKTPSSLPPRSKTPAGPPAASRPAPTSAVRGAPPPRPASVMKGLISRSAAETPAMQNGTLRRNLPMLGASAASAAPASQIRSPSKIPSRVPLGNLQYGNNSPERRMHSPPKHNSQQNHAYTAKTMGPPRVPPPKMRDLFTQPPSQSSTNTCTNAPPPRPASANSNLDSQSSSRYVRPVSPEDVYDDRERMSYMSASLLQRDQNAAYHNHHDFDSAMHRYAPSASSTSQMPSRQISNSSSNLTTGTTASGSENWESYSDNGSELEPERDLRDPYYIKTQGLGSKRLPGDFAHMAPPPKMRMHDRIDDGSENAKTIRVEGSDAAWSTEASETY
jgi:Ase1/PRC1/MAP65 family protein